MIQSGQDIVRLTRYDLMHDPPLLLKIRQTAVNPILLRAQGFQKAALMVIGK